MKQKIQSTWSTSSPENVSRAPVKFLGMEVQKEKEEETGRDVWAITQESYVTDLLEGWDKKMKKIPISKDQSITQPDRMFGVLRMGASALKATDAVHKETEQMKGSLWRTKREGLLFKEEAESDIILKHSEESHGSFVILLETSPLFWRSGSQGLVTLSTAEVEMNEMTEGIVSGESIGVIVEELFGFIPKMLWTDSMAGLGHCDD